MNTLIPGMRIRWTNPVGLMIEGEVLSVKGDYVSLVGGYSVSRAESMSINVLSHPEPGSALVVRDANGYVYVRPTKQSGVWRRLIVDASLPGVEWGQIASPVEVLDSGDDD